MDTTATKQTGTGKVALVTGASGGIGKAVAERLAKDGFSVVAGYSGASDKVEATVTGITERGGKAVSVTADIAEAAEVAKLFKETVAQYNRLDVVVHCAGIMPLSPIEKGDVELFDKVIATNLRGTFLIFCEAAKTRSALWKKQRRKPKDSGAPTPSLWRFKPETTTARPMPPCSR